METERGLKGSAFIAATLCLSQYQPLDLLMYYDARPCAMNGLFKPYDVSKNLKGYYSLFFFNQLYRLGQAVEITGCEAPVAACAARQGDHMAVLLTHFTDQDDAPPVRTRLALEHLQEKERPLRISYYQLDAVQDGALVREEIVTGVSAAVYLTLPAFTTYLIQIEPARLEAENA